MIEKEVSIMSLRFSHIGFSNVICANKVKAIIPPYLATGRRYTKVAKEHGLFIDASSGREVKSLLLMDDGGVIGCALNPKTVMGRLSSGKTGDDWEENDDTSGGTTDG